MNTLHMPDPDKLFQQAVSHHQSGDLIKAIEMYRYLIRQYPDSQHLLSQLGTAEAQSGNLLESVDLFSRSIQINPDNPDTHNNLGIAFRELKQFEKAVQCYDRAVQLKPDYPEAHYNRGVALHELERFHEALQSYDHAVELNSDYPDLLFARGSALQKLKRLDEALLSYERAITRKPDNDFWLGVWFYVKLGSCNWNKFVESKNELINKIRNNEKAVEPFLTLLLTDSLELQNKSATNWVKHKCVSSGLHENIAKYPRHGKIRLGYFSADFRNHATMHLMAEVLERHDRTKFELYGFSFGPETNDYWSKRSQRCFDRFFNVRLVSDQAVAQCARDLQLDIAVDLTGFTTFSRPDIFARRAAPIQVNYLGYPGTMGADFIDYIIADTTIIPETDRHQFTEKVVWLPGCYMANCRDRDVSQKSFSRADLNLPDDGFVFICFNNSNKITPAVFDSWMRILQQVNGSVLWLLESNAMVVNSLRMEAEARGVNPERLVFAPVFPVEDHLARIRNADLFLDTHPYNAHTTASDTLRMGVPLVTVSGKSFSGRVAASLLKTLDLDELITDSAAEYEKTAIDLAINRNRLQKIKEKLDVNIQTSSLFDSELFTRNIEEAYKLMYERYQNDLAPDHMTV